MKILSLAMLAMAAALAAPALADPAITNRPVTMRDAPNPRAAPVQQIPADAEIDLNECRRGWCFASWRNVFGYIPANSADVTDAPDPVPVHPGPFFGPPPVYGPPVVVGPGIGFGVRIGPRPWHHPGYHRW